MLESNEELRRVGEQCPAAEESDSRDLNRLVTRLLDAVSRYRGDE